MIIWLTGLSGSGKTTIGKEIHRLLKYNRSVAFIDGDEVRRIVGDELGYDLNSRKVNAWRICRFCQYLEHQNIDVVCSTISMFSDIHEWNKGYYKRYYAVYIDVPMKELRSRDQKGIYSRYQAGELHNVVGLDLPFFPPEQPDVVIKNGSPLKSPIRIAEETLTKLGIDFSFEVNYGSA